MLRSTTEDAARPGRIDAIVTSIARSTEIFVMAIGWHNGIKSLVRLAPWIAAMRAIVRTLQAVKESAHG